MSIEELFRDGYTVIPSLIDSDECDRLRTDLALRHNGDCPYNFNPYHRYIRLGDDAESFPNDIVSQPRIHELLRDVFGSGYYMYSYMANVMTHDIDEKNRPVCEEQPFHMDCTHFHPLSTIKAFGSPGPPIQIIVNTYLQDTDERNGSLEIVPGSHLWTDFTMGEDGDIDRKYISHTVRCNLPKGSVIIRDKRTWHRGTKITPDQVCERAGALDRYMVGTSYSLNWFQLGKLRFARDCEPLLDNAPFSKWNIEYYDKTSS